MKTIRNISAILFAVICCSACSQQDGVDAEINFIAGVNGGETICYFPDRTENSIELGINAHGTSKVIYPCVNGYFTAAERGAVMYVSDIDARLFKYADNGESETIASGFYHIGYVNEGLVPAVREREPIVILNTNGDEVFTAGPVEGIQVAEVSPVFSEGLLWFRLKDDREGYFDKKGNAKILLDYDQKVSPDSENTFGCNFHNGFVIVGDKNNFYILNDKGELSAPISHNYDEIAIRYKKNIFFIKKVDFTTATAAYDCNGKSDPKALESFNKMITDQESEKSKNVNIKMLNESAPPFKFDWFGEMLGKELGEDGDKAFIDAFSLTIALLGQAIESQGDAIEQTESDEDSSADVEEIPMPKTFNSLATTGLMGAVKSVTKGNYTDEYDTNGELLRRTAYGNEYDKRTYSTPTTYKDNEGDVTIIITENNRKETGPNDYLRGIYTFDSIGRIIKAHCLMDMEYVDITYSYDGDSLLPSTVTTTGTGAGWNAIEKFSYLETDKHGNWTKAKVTTTTTYAEDDEFNDGGTETRTETVYRTITYWE